jgi:4-hydroxy-tetrahydrodipicolinate reductase
MAIRVGVFGAGGRMGATVCQAVAADPHLELVAAVDPLHAGIDLRQVVVGTTGFTPEDYDHLRREFAKSNCLVAPNFAIGAVLMMRFAEIAAPFFETAEIIEMHHDQKVDAPSGTAMMTAQRMAAASSDWAPDPTTDVVVPGARGGRGPGEIPVHSVRLRGVVAHQEVLLGTTGQSLSIRHDSYDRASFMPGVLLGVKRIADVDGLTIGLDTLLGL